MKLTPPPKIDITLVQVFRQTVNLKDGENSFSQSANRLCPNRGSLSPPPPSKWNKTSIPDVCTYAGLVQVAGAIGAGPTVGQTCKCVCYLL